MAKMLFEAVNLKGGLRLKRWLIGLLIFLLASLLAINSFTIGQFRLLPLGNATNQVSYIETKPQESAINAAVQSGYLVNTKGCRIPYLSPFEPSMMRYFEKAKPIVCEHGAHLPLVDSNNSAIFVNPDARGHFYNETESIDCCWRRFWRTDNKENEVTVSKDCHPFEDSAIINDEFVRVDCQRRNESIYRDYFAFVPRKHQVEERCRRKAHEDLQKGRNTRKLSILVLGIDSVSRLNMHRSMPRTLHLLRNMSAAEMLGYNKVADNTYPNLVPVLSGYSEDEFEKICWTDHKNTFDRCPFIWNKFSANGYRTIFAEDACYMTIFNYLKPGFTSPPTDYYLRPYCVATEDEIGNTHKLNADLCVGTRYTFDNLLHYTRKIAEEFVDDPYFAFFWMASLTHDYIEFAQLGDDFYHDLIDQLNKQGQLRNTVLILMSDHGMRWGSFRQTYQGRLEDSLPFLFIRPPEWWIEQYPAAWAQLNRNARKLTTAYDVHMTLHDFLDPSRLQAMQDSNNVGLSNDGEDLIGRGISLFKPIGDQRTCATAGIPEHWCMCHSRYNVSHDDPIVGQIVLFLVQEINSWLTKYPGCAKLHMIALHDAKALKSSGEGSDPDKKGEITEKDKKLEKEKMEKKNEAPWTDYTVTIETVPGNGVFEGSVRYGNEVGNMSLVGSVSRLNVYGLQSACIDDFQMRLYCYCLH